MRQLKFRAWNGKEMTNEGFHVSAQGNVWKWTDYTFSDSKLWKAPIMQFTGLTDKNGKEIYDGDIILNRKATSPEDNGWIVKWKDFGFVYELNGYPEIEPEIPFNTTGIDFEIIGNIYENPELIK